MRPAALNYHDLEKARVPCAQKSGGSAAFKPPGNTGLVSRIAKTRRMAALLADRTVGIKPFLPDFAKACRGPSNPPGAGGNFNAA